MIVVNYPFIGLSETTHTNIPPSLGYFNNTAPVFGKRDVRKVYHVFVFSGLRCKGKCSLPNFIILKGEFTVVRFELISFPVYHPANTGGLQQKVRTEAYRAILNLLAIVSLNASISRPILSLVILAYIWVVVICLWPSILLTVSNGTPCESVTVVENVCRAS